MKYETPNLKQTLSTTMQIIPNIARRRNEFLYLSIKKISNNFLLLNHFGIPKYL